MMIDHTWTTRCAESKTSNPERLPLLGNFSVWLGFFLFDAMQQFIELANLRGDNALAQQLATASEQLRVQLERHGWDGEWYRR
ncbi:MAG: GH36-type glycosyl hydrolase domain-containing protein, partial [Phycisphaerae bacterium]